MMIHFRNDYSDIAHPSILQRLIDLQHETHLGYGMDSHVEHAKTCIKKAIGIDRYIHLMTGGTSANKTVIAHLLKPYEAVISAHTGHIEVHETGAIEATGHKIISIPTEDGKLTPLMIQNIYQRHSDEHMVKPKMVYISNATETGQIYTKQELKSLFEMCQLLGLYLYLDGARLGVALTSKPNDLTLHDIALYTDLFYIGGTKNGALLGEAVVMKDPKMDEFFRYSIKQQGGLLAKGFVAGIQFEVLFEHQLFFDIGQQANKMAEILVNELHGLGLDFQATPTNQQFITPPSHVVDELMKDYTFEIWQDHGHKRTIRLVTTYRTTHEEIKHLIRDIKRLMM
jgi:threonine aldolase